MIEMVKNSILGRIFRRKIQYNKKARIAFISFGIIALVAVVILFLWDIFPSRFPTGAHNLLGAFPLVLIALVYLVSHLLKSPTRGELIKAVLLAVAFFFWAANQLWPQAPAASLFNDLAIGLFSLDIFFIIFGWPRAFLE